MTETINVTQTINIPAARAWDAISDIGNLDRWFPIIESCTVNGEGPGAKRVCRLVDGSEVHEAITDIDHSARRFCYTIVASPMPISNYLGTVEVKDAGGAGAEISWTVEFDVATEARDEIVAMLQTAFSDGISGIERDLGSET